MGFHGLRSSLEVSLALIDTVGAWSWTLSIHISINSWKRSLFGGADGVGRTGRIGPGPEDAGPGDVELGARFLSLP